MNPCLNQDLSTLIVRYFFHTALESLNNKYRLIFPQQIFLLAVPQTRALPQSFQ